MIERLKAYALDFAKAVIAGAAAAAVAWLQDADLAAVLASALGVGTAVGFGPKDYGRRFALRGK